MLSVSSFQPCKEKIEKLMYYVGAVGITIVVIQVNL